MISAEIIETDTAVYNQYKMYKFLSLAEHIRLHLIIYTKDFFVLS